MKNIFSLEGKRAVVIGGAGGLGRAIVAGLASFGATVCVADRSQEILDRAESELIAEYGINVLTCVVDVSEEASVLALAETVRNTMGGVDILVNSQGLNKKVPSVSIDMDDWDNVFRVNVRGMLLVCRTMAREFMIPQRYGKIITISSIRGIRALNGEGNTAYSTSKGAVEMLTKSLAGEWGRYNITVNAIGPIITETPMMKAILAADPVMKEKTAAFAPLGRLGLPEDTVGPAVFLASDASAFVTGQTIYPDGGTAAVC